MKKYAAWIVLLVLVAGSSCRQPGHNLVDSKFTDSLTSQYSPSEAEKLNAAELQFWQQRLDSSAGAATPTSRVAGALSQHFHLYGNIYDLLAADSMLSALSSASRDREAGLLRSLAATDITRHRFKGADSLVRMALVLGAERYNSLLMQFDTRFELGDYVVAGNTLAACAATNEYGYFFRMAKWMHFRGETDSAVFYLQQALKWTGTSHGLRQAALSNLGDLYMHDGRMKEAADSYMQSIRIDAADWRSLQGLGRIALLNDGHPDVAEKIFAFIRKRIKLPDAAYNFIWLAEQQKDTVATKRAALAFAGLATDPVYGGMYNKYLVEYYTGILDQPEKALELAAVELNNRATPQTYCWYAWSLHCSGKEKEAMDIYSAHVSGKPLEALELFWMGKMMAAMHKQYNAQAFYKAAAKNISDLSPMKQAELQAALR
jgi:tetratricopeptide (TPR) repeat protein